MTNITGTLHEAQYTGTFSIISRSEMLQAKGVQKIKTHTYYVQ
jgi:hypothetical protein